MTPYEILHAGGGDAHISSSSSCTLPTGQRSPFSAIPISSLEDLHLHLGQDAANIGGGRLVVLQAVCPKTWESGANIQEADLMWKLDVEEKRAAELARGTAIMEHYRKLASACPDVTFLMLQLPEDIHEAHKAAQAFGITTLPTVQVWRRGRIMNEIKGTDEMELRLFESESRAFVHEMVGRG